MAGNDVRIVVTADADQARRELKEVEGAAGKVSGAFGNMAQVAGGFVVGAAITNLPGVLISGAKAAAEDEAATLRLNQAIRNAGGDFDANVQSVEARIAAGQKLAFTDDQVRDSFQQLLASTGNTTEALKRQRLAMDFSRGAGIDLQTASRLLGKVTAENVEVFKRMGITIGEGATEADAFAAIQAKFAGQADVYAQSSAGQFEIAQIKMAEAKETIAMALLPAMTGLAAAISGGLVPAIEAMEPVLEVIAKSIAFVAKHFDLFGPILAGIAIVMVAAFIPALIAMTTATWGAVTGALALAAAWAATPFGMITIAVGALVAGVILLITHWDSITAKFPLLGTAAEGVKTAIETLTTFVTNTVMPALKGLWDFFDKDLLPILKTAIDIYLLPLKLAFEGVKIIIADVLIPALSALWGFMTNTLFPAVQTAIDIYLLPLKVAFEGAKAAVDILKTGFNEIKGPIEELGTKLGDLISKAIDPVKDAFNFAKDAVYSMRDAIWAIRDAIGELIGKLGELAGKVNVFDDIPGVGAIGGMIPGGNPFKAAGGPVVGGGAYIVGEKGPELFVPAASGTIVPNGAWGQSQAAQPLTVNLVVDGEVLARVVMNSLNKAMA